MKKAFEILKKIRGLEEERDGELVEYYRIEGNKKVYYTNATLNDEGNLLAYVSKERVTVFSINQTTEVFTSWHIGPANDEPVVGKLKFYKHALIILYHDLKTYHLAKLLLPKDDLEFGVTVIQLGINIHISKDIIYYQPRGRDLNIHSIALPEMRKLPVLTKEEAKNKGIEVSNYLFFELDDFIL